MEKIDKTKKTKKNSNSFIDTRPQLTGVVEQHPAVASTLHKKILSIAEKRKDQSVSTPNVDIIEEDMPFLVDVALTEKLSDKMDKLLRLGLGNPSKIRQYQQALEDPSGAMKYSAMREHIVDVLNKLVAIIEGDSAIYQRIYDSLTKRLRNPAKPSVAYQTLRKKAMKESIDYPVLAEVYLRGVNSWTPKSILTVEQYAFNRVNSFVHGGKAAQLDEDLMKDPCWKGYKMVGTKKKKGKEVPNCVPEESNPFINVKPKVDKKAVKREIYNTPRKSADPMSEASTPSQREIGTDSLVSVYTKDTPGQHKKTLAVIKNLKSK